GSLCGTWWRRPSSITHALRICRCVRAPRHHGHDRRRHPRLARASVAPLLLAGFTVPVPVHLRIGTVAKEVFRLRARRHLRAMGAAVASERGSGGDGQTRGRGRGLGSAPWGIAGRRPGLRRLYYGCLGAIGHAGPVLVEANQDDGAHADQSQEMYELHGGLRIIDDITVRAPGSARDAPAGAMSDAMARM